MRRLNERNTESISLDLFGWDATISIYRNSDDYRNNRPYAEETYVLNINAMDLSLTEQSIKNAICKRLNMDYGQFDSFYFSKEENRLMLSALLSKEQLSSISKSPKFRDVDEMNEYIYIQGSLEVFIKAYRSLSEDDVEEYSTFKIGR